MPRFFKKPEEIEAMQFYGTTESANKVFAWLRKLNYPTSYMFFIFYPDGRGRLEVKEKVRALEDDYIILREDGSLDVMGEQEFHKNFGHIQTEEV